MAPLLAGTQFAHYQIISTLGAGGMGVVYRARDTRLERDVALKLLAEAPSQEARDRLVAEARAASALNHANVATIYEVGEAGGHSYIAMEHVQGRPLSKQIPPEGLPMESVIRYGMQIAAALAHAHERGVLHRDLKSANVAITPEGQAKVLDFGLAARLSHDELHGVTRSIEAIEKKSAAAGTLHYMAPEVLRGEPADARSDIWALGVVLHEMAAGRLPFEGRTGFELTSAILKESPAPLPAHVPPGLRGVIQRCLAKEPGQRYRNAGEVRAALEAISSDTAATPAPAVAAQAAPAHGRPWWRSPAALIVLAVGTLVGLGIWKGPFVASVGVTKTAPPPGKRTSTGGPASANPEANLYYEQGNLWLTGQFDLDRAKQNLERAIQLDPNFAEARAQYGFTFLLEIDMGRVNDRAALYRAEQEIRRALQTDPNLARGHSALGGVLFYRGRWQEARSEEERALQLNAKEIDPLIWEATRDQMAGNYEQMKRRLQPLIEVNPLFFPARAIYAEALRQQGDFPAALHEDAKLVEQDPKNPAAVVLLAIVQMDMGNLAGARATLEQARQFAAKNFQIRIAWATLLALEGKRDLALKEMDAEVQKYGEICFYMTHNIAEFYSVLGDIGSAMMWLERALQNGDERAEWFQRDPLLANARKSPRFKQILDSIALMRQQRTR